MSTQQALGVVGGVVGMFFGYPQLGFVVGSLVGGLLTPKEKIEGPRVEDLKVQVSTYGAGIPVVYGNARVGGNVIWSTDKIETETTEDVGKGGGAENTTYRYFVHMRIRLCETPSDGQPVSIRKIWQDGKLIYDASSGVPLGSAIASAENPHAFLVLYQGYEDQLPDPIEEVFLGIGNVPAYRGGVDVRLNAVECPGGRVPQFSFEVCIGATTVTNVATMCEAEDASGHHAYFESDGVWHYNYQSPGTGIYTLGVWRGGVGFMEPVGRWPLPYAHGGALHTFTPIPCQGSSRPTVLRSRADSNSIDCYIEDIALETGEVQVIYRYTKAAIDPVLMSSQYSSCARDPAGGRYVILGGQTTTLATTPKVINTDEAQGAIGLLDCAPLVGTPGPVAMFGGFVYAVTEVGGFVQIEVRNALSGAVVGTPVPGPSIGSAQINQAAINASARGVFVYLHDQGTSTVRIYRVTGLPSGADWELRFSTPAPANYPFSSANFYGSNQLSIIGPNTSSTPDYSVLSLGLVLGQADVSWVISDQCRRAGLLPDQFDVTGIADTLHGYTLTNPASARANLQPLMTAFAIDATEEDGRLKFFKRASKSSVATILYEELGTVEGDSEAGDPMPLTRAQDAELPRSVSASYTNKDFDYQTGTEKAIRQIFDSQNDMMVDLSMSTTSDHAATVAQAILYDSHNDRNKRSLKVSRKYAFLSAGDVVTVEYPATVLSEWRILQLTDTGALIEGECVPFDAAIYTQTAVGATGYAGQVVAPLPPPTRLQILDIPILRDQDNNAGIYTAMAGFGPNWPGASLQTWDDPANVENRGAVEREAPIGFVESALGNWTSGIVDESNLLTVNVGQSELNSITYDALLTGTANVAAVGAPGRWEIVKFRSAASLGDGRYILSGFMRGQRGTEWARGTHAVNDTFVLLSMAGMLRPNFDAGSIGQSKTYRAVTKGRSPSSGSTQTYANTAEGLETFSPTNLDKSISGGDITLSVVRRTRLSENWLRGIVPMGEDAERFEFELFTSNTFATLRRVILSTSRSAVYTAAMQAADGYASGPLYVRVYQLSGVVGRGHALQETI